jgi:hypothetical protein
LIEDRGASVSTLVSVVKKAELAIEDDNTLTIRSRSPTFCLT